MKTIPGQLVGSLSYGRSIEQGPHSASDYWKLPLGDRTELVRGFLLEPPPASPRHQAVVGVLVSLVLDVCRRSGGSGVVGPVNVILGNSTIVQPDVVYIAPDRRSIIAEDVDGVPDLIVEVESPNHAARDRVHKLALYAEHGVPEYWIVDPAERVIEFLLLDGDRYKVEPLTSDAYQSPRLAEVAIDLPSFWADVAKLIGG